MRITSFVTQDVGGGLERLVPLRALYRAAEGAPVRPKAHRALAMGATVTAAALHGRAGAPRLHLLAAEVHLTRRYLPDRPHRWVTNELTDRLAGPLFGPLDRGRDAVRHLRACLPGTR
jgi:hypothetical protein